jgi:DNA repair protein RadD
MIYVPRDYQDEAKRESLQFLTSGDKEHGVIILPTGAGKSLVIAQIVDALKEPCIVFQPSKELLEQNLQKFIAYGYNPAVFSASARQQRVGKITLATIGSVVKKTDYFQHCKYAIVDECHLVNSKDGMYQQFFSALPNVRILGLTATPYRLGQDGYGGSIMKFLTRTRPRVFSKVVHVVQNKTLFYRGYLARLEYKQVDTGFRHDRLRLNTTGADYTDESVQNHFKELHFSDQVVRCVHRLNQLNRHGVLVFTRFVEEAEYVASKIPGARFVTSDTPKAEREEILEGFKAGTIPTVSNVGVLGIGFDYPALANVVLANPTRSLARYYQWVGRILRPHPSKDCGFVIDMVGAVKRFGKVEDLMIKDAGDGKWFVESNGRALTGVYYKDLDTLEQENREGVTDWKPSLNTTQKWKPHPQKPAAATAEAPEQELMVWEQ